MTNTQPETHPEVFVYPEEGTHGHEMPKFRVVIFSPIKLSPDCVLCRMEVVNEPGKFKELTGIIREKNINILRTCDSTIINRGIIELYLDFSKATAQVDAFIPMLEKLRREGTIFDYSTPEPLSEVCSLKPFRKIASCTRITPSRSNPTLAQLKLGRDILERIALDWMPSENQGPIASVAIVSTYLRFPMLISAFVRPSQKLLRIKVGLKDRPGALDEILEQVKSLATIYASNLTKVTGASGFWDAFVFPLNHVTREYVEKTLSNISEEWIDKTKKIDVEEIVR